MKRLFEQSQVRPGILVAGIALLAAALGFVVVNFLFLGDSSEPVDTPVAQPAPQQPTQPTPTVTEEPVPLGEGRDPFVPVGGAAAPAAVEEPTDPLRIEVEVVAVAEDASFANIRVNEITHERAQPGQELSEGLVVQVIEGTCVNLVREDQQYLACQGETVPIDLA